MTPTVTANSVILGNCMSQRCMNEIKGLKVGLESLRMCRTKLDYVEYTLTSHGLQGGFMLTVYTE